MGEKEQAGAQDRRGLPQVLLEATQGSLARVGEAHLELEKRRQQPLRSGDALVFETLAELKVQWVIVEHDAESQRFLVVAADLNPLVGSADVAVPASNPGGPLTLRGRFAMELRAPDLDVAARTGFVKLDVVEQMRLKRAAVERGDPPGSPLEVETDCELEYQDWSEELTKTRDALRAKLDRQGKLAVRSVPDAAVGPGSAAVKFLSLPSSHRTNAMAAGSPWRDFFANPYWVAGVAASTLLTVGLCGALFWQQARISGLERERAGIAGELQEAGEEHRNVAEQLSLQIAELEQEAVAPPDAAAAFLLSPQDQERSEALIGPWATLRLLAVPSHIVLPFYVRESYFAYQLEARQRDTDRVVWRRNGLVQYSPEKVTVVVEGALLPPGDYWFHLYGLRDETTTDRDLVDEYALRVEIQEIAQKGNR